jgi:hypothetical protein
MSWMLYLCAAVSVWVAIMLIIVNVLILTA